MNNSQSYILAIETSCDETSVALVDDGNRIHANVIASQTELHAPYGGVVPELASRAHVERILPLLQEAWERSDGLTWRDLDAVAVTYGPGLAGCLLVGIECAKGLSLAWRKPLVGVNHLAGHLWSIFLRNPDGNLAAQFHRAGESISGEEFAPPYMGLIVSGGHSSLVLVRGVDDMETVGQTMDDAAGEAYDKVAKLLGLGYPGGPILDRLAREHSGEIGEPWILPRPLEGRATLDFSFSGLKSAVVRLVERQGGPEAITSSSESLRALCASFQRTVVDFLLLRARKALDRHRVQRLAITGGVACNRGLREAIARVFPEQKYVVALPPPILCTDNAAMIGAVAHGLFGADRTSGYDLDPRPSLTLSALG
jgi:N6-L-threonylcarbamoyladenine synthase